MTLSYTNLEKLLLRKGFLPRRVYVMDGNCVYVEILVVSSGDIFLLYIQSKYALGSPDRATTSVDICQVKYLEVDDDANVIDGEDVCADIQAPTEDNDLYTEIELSISKPVDNLDKQLENNYEKPIQIRNVTKEEMTEIRDIFKQLRRFKNCVANLRYKLCVVYGKTICCIRRDNTYEGYIMISSRDTNGTPKRRILVSTDLEALYEMHFTLASDVHAVRAGVYEIIDKNHLRHASILSKLLEYRANLLAYVNLIATKKNKYASHLVKLETMMRDVSTSETRVRDKMAQIEDTYQKKGSSLNTDVRKSHELSRCKEELHRINEIKQELISAITNVRIEYENLSFLTDKVYFDNTVMVNRIMQNVVSLEKLNLVSE